MDWRDMVSGRSCYLRQIEAGPAYRPGCAGLAKGDALEDPTDRCQDFRRYPGQARLLAIDLGLEFGELGPRASRPGAVQVSCSHAVVRPASRSQLRW